MMYKTKVTVCSESHTQHIRAKWEVGAYSRTTQLIRRKDVLFYYEKTTCFGLHWPSSGFFYRLRGSIYLSGGS